jgi:hypothetical protein
MFIFGEALKLVPVKAATFKNADNRWAFYRRSSSSNDTIVGRRSTGRTRVRGSRSPTRPRLRNARDVNGRRNAVAGAVDVLIYDVTAAARDKLHRTNGKRSEGKNTRGGCAYVCGEIM